MVFVTLAAFNMERIVSEPSLIHFLAAFFVAGVISGQWLAVVLVPASVAIVGIIDRLLGPDPGTYSELTLLGQVILSGVLLVFFGFITGLGVGFGMMAEGLVRLRLAPGRRHE